MTAQLNPTYIFNPRSDDSVVELSPTQILKGLVCLRSLGYSRAKVKSKATPINLVFGSALHWVIEGFVKGFIPKDEMERRFEEKFQELSMAGLISMAKSKTREVNEAIGKRLAGQFPAFYENLGLRPVVIEGAFKLQIGPKTFINMVIDFVGVAERDIIFNGEVFARKGDTVILDWKTAAAKEGALFAGVALQLTLYWAAVCLACKKLGIKPPSACGFASGLKPNITKEESESLINATWMPIQWTRRSTSDIEDALDLARALAGRIRRGEFHRVSGAAYNSPCDSQTLCDYAGLCLTASTRGYKIPDGLTIADLV
ncbi:PD-(D/E)XK nuclease family protein [Pseudomonas aeruginosa]|uniref:PD-(D/E)XK nuclease family protein n=1 Tax=Pseudomonas aeruginosa TaxID=287 RepID=UPI003D2BCD65